ncbi:hypothetical protein ACFLQY_01115 [Verrucomicrobiota bacterium]
MGEVEKGRIFFLSHNWQIRMRMAKKKIDGVNFKQGEGYATCHIDEFSEELESCLRSHLATICHGDHLASRGLKSYTYESTLIIFCERYENKTDETKKGMIGELLCHVLFSEYFPEYEIISPFFNMEEKSIRKGFDLVLYSRSEKNVWISEVKSGELLINDTPDKATQRYLDAGKKDLNRRLNENSNTFWLNAVNAACIAISNCRDYKDAVIRILDQEGGAALNHAAASSDNNVVFVSALFADISDKFAENIPKNFSRELQSESLFERSFVFSVQKSTYDKIADFILREACRA